jgi:hypothetical protein
MVICCATKRHQSEEWKQRVKIKNLNLNKVRNSNADYSITDQEGEVLSVEEIEHFR